MNDDRRTAAYEAPSITVIGTLHELTLANPNKGTANSLDGTKQGHPQPGKHHKVSF